MEIERDPRKRIEDEGARPEVETDAAYEAVEDAMEFAMTNYDLSKVWYGWVLRQMFYQGIDFAREQQNGESGPRRESES